MLYECHITVPTKDADKAKFFADNRRAEHNIRWKTSEIARDPLLGDDTFFYLTCHSGSVEEIFAEMHFCSSWLKQGNVDILREKIELIIHDTGKKLLPVAHHPV